MTAKYQLMVNTDNPADIAAIIAVFNSSTAPLATIAPVTVNHSNIAGGATPTGTEDDDENNDTQADATGVDKNGLPWDDRIHSTPAKLTKKGEWRAKRNVDDNFVKQVEAELRARGQQPVQHAPMQQMQPAQAPAVQPMPMQQPAPYQQPVSAPFDPAQQPQYQPQPAPQYPQQPVQHAPMQPQQMQQPAPYQQPPLTVVPTGLDFNGFMQKVQVLLQQRDTAGNPWIDAVYLQGIAQKLGVIAITDIMNNPAQIDHAIALMTQDGKWM